jgi:predicted RNase H-like HicB family nuclease
MPPLSLNCEPDEAAPSKARDGGHTSPASLRSATFPRTRGEVKEVTCARICRIWIIAINAWARCGATLPLPLLVQTLSADYLLSMLRVETEREDDGRCLAEVPALPGVLGYGATDAEARSKVIALALRVIAERIENGEALPREIAGMLQPV